LAYARHVPSRAVCLGACFHSVGTKGWESIFGKSDELTVAKKKALKQIQCENSVSRAPHPCSLSHSLSCSLSLSLSLSLSHTRTHTRACFVHTHTHARMLCFPDVGLRCTCAQVPALLPPCSHTIGASSSYGKTTCHTSTGDACIAYTCNCGNPLDAVLPHRLLIILETTLR
jgi:hypothetical protein